MVDCGKIHRSAKVFGSETSYRLNSEWMKVLSLYGQLDMYSRHAPLDGRVNRWFYNATRDLLTRGTSEIMKNIIDIMFRQFSFNLKKGAKILGTLPG